MPRVFIPPELRSLTDGVEMIDVSAATVRDAVAAVDQQFPGLQMRLCDGVRLRPGLMVSVDGVFSTLRLRERVRPDSEIHFLPAIGGG